jgi:uncharacterized delta-60 repeat protein
MLKIMKPFYYLKIFFAVFLFTSLFSLSHSLVYADGYETIMSASSTGVDNYVRRIGIQQDNKIIIAGYIAAYNGQSGTNVHNFIRLNENGTHDDTYYMAHFGGLDREVYDLEVLPDDSIIMAGSFFEWPNHTPLGGIVKLNAGGLSVDLNGLNPRFDGAVNALDIDSSGNIYAVGNFTTYGGVTKKGFARLDSDGVLDTAYTSGTGFEKEGGSMYISDISLDSNGDPYMVGNFDAFNGTSTTAKIIKLNSDGIDTNFSAGTGFDTIPTLVQVDPNGKIIVKGEFTTYKGQSVPNIVRLNADGSIDSTFDAGTGFTGGSLSAVNKIIFQDDDKIIMVGDFAEYDENSSPKIVRLNTDGSYDETFAVGTGFNAEVYDAVFDMNGDLIIAGFFSEFNGETANRIARLSLDSDSPILDAFTSDTPDGTYTVDDEIEVTATFSEDLKVGSTMNVRLNTGNDLILDSIDGSNLSGTYIVQEGDSAMPLAIMSVNSINVSDTKNNIKTTVIESFTDLSSTKNIIVDAVLEPASEDVVDELPSNRRGRSGSSRRVIASSVPTSNSPVATSNPTPSTGNADLQSISNNPRDLELNATGDDVKLLQQFLNSQGFAINTSGQVGSAGYETTYFGTLTQQALIKFQQAHNITPSMGYFGPKTRAFIKGL